MSNISFVFSKYDDIFEIFIKQYMATQEDPITVFDDGLSKKIKAEWNKCFYVDSVKNADGTFSAPKTMNRAFNLFQGCDILFFCDDCYIHTPDLANKLRSVAYRELSAGLVVPTMTNVWCSLQRNATDRLPWADKEYIVVPNIEDKVYSSYDISAVCFFLKSDVIKKVGLYDEGFIGHGEFCDLDYSIRVRHTGYQNIIVQSCFVEHGGERFGCGDRTTRRRARSDDLENIEHIKNSDYFIKKWKLN